jgi:hypothetical protein
MKQYGHYDIPRGDKMSHEEYMKRLDEEVQKRRERDATLENLSWDQIGKRYIEWLNSRDPQTYEKLINGFEPWYRSLSA